MASFEGSSWKDTIRSSDSSSRRSNSLDVTRNLSRLLSQPNDVSTTASYSPASLSFGGGSFVSAQSVKEMEAPYKSSSSTRYDQPTVSYSPASSYFGGESFVSDKHTLNASLNASYGLNGEDDYDMSSIEERLNALRDFSTAGNAVEQGDSESHTSWFKEAVDALSSDSGRLSAILESNKEGLSDHLSSSSIHDLRSGSSLSSIHDLRSGSSLSSHGDMSSKAKYSSNLGKFESSKQYDTAPEKYEALDSRLGHGGEDTRTSTMPRETRRAPWKIPLDSSGGYSRLGSQYTAGVEHWQKLHSSSGNTEGFQQPDADTRLSGQGRSRGVFSKSGRSKVSSLWKTVVTRNSSKRQSTVGSNKVSGDRGFGEISRDRSMWEKFKISTIKEETDEPLSSREALERWDKTPWYRL